MVQTKKHSALFFLFIFTAYLLCGSVAKGFSYQTDLINQTGVILKKSCHNSQHSTHFAQAPKQIDETQNLPGNTDCSTVPVPCNSSLQILPVTNGFLIEASQQDQLIEIRGLFFVTQIVVFQEPDPPRFG